MGNTQTQLPLNFHTDNHLIINHHKFANPHIFKNPTGQTLVTIRCPILHQKEYNTWAQQLAKIQSHCSLLLPNSHTFKKEGLCGMSGVAELTFQFYPYLLRDEINNRYHMDKKYFEESQLWYLTLTLLSAAEQFHPGNKKVGDVRPENIFIDDDGSVKVACLGSWPSERTNYQKTFQKEITNISPQQLQDIQLGKLISSSNLQLAQTFSIGLSLLDAATLSNSKDIYTGPTSIDYDTLSHRIEELGQNNNYSQLLRTIIINMCEVNPQNRTSCRQLYQWISSYEDHIHNFQPFQAKGLPEKIKLKMLSYSQLNTYQSPITLLPQNPSQTSNKYIQSYPNSKTIKCKEQASSSIKKSQLFQQFPHILASTYLPIYESASSAGHKTHDSAPYRGGQTSFGSYNSESGQGGGTTNFWLQKIDEHLDRSKKMFPS